MGRAEGKAYNPPSVGVSFRLACVVGLVLLAVLVGRFGLGVSGLSEGLVLTPNQLYLGRTVERTETHNYVPMIEGRSSIGRLGLFVHVTAGFGDVGFCGYWTLEMFAVQPVKIYPGVPICQIFFHEISGLITEYASDKYQHNRDIQPSLLFREFGAAADGSQQLHLEFESDRHGGAPLSRGRAVTRQAR